MKVFGVCILLALCVISKGAGWKEVKRGVDIPCDIESVPLSIKTSGSGWVDVRFYSQKAWDLAGGIVIKFNPKPQYLLTSCGTWTPFPVPLPTQQDNVWTISKSLEPRIVVLCNNVEVLNLQLSNCTSWSKDVAKIRFRQSDRASVSHSTSCDIRGGWMKVVRDVELKHDLDTAPLHLKTNSELGSNDKVVVWFRNKEGSSTGGFELHFYSKIKYSIHKCQKKVNNVFPESIPDDVNKVWTIERTTKGLKVSCNGKLLLTFVFSNDACAEYGPAWRDKWNQSTKVIYFPSQFDTASDYWVTNQACFNVDPEDYCWEDNSWWDGPGCCKGGARENKATQVADRVECAEMCHNEPDCVQTTYWYVKGEPEKKWCRIHSLYRTHMIINDTSVLEGGLNLRQNKNNPYKTTGASKIMSASKNIPHINLKGPKKPNGCSVEDVDCWKRGTLWNGPGFEEDSQKMPVCGRSECKQMCADHEECKKITYWRQPGGEQYCRLHSFGSLRLVNLAAVEPNTVLPKFWSTGTGKIEAPVGTIFFTSTKDKSCS